MFIALHALGRLKSMTPSYLDRFDIVVLLFLIRVTPRVRFINMSY